MDGSVSDIDYILILFMKMQKESRLGSKHQQKTILEGVLFMYVLTNTNSVGLDFFHHPTFSCFAVYGHGVSEVRCKWSEGK